MAKEVLGPEWGQLAGLPYEEGMKLIAEMYDATSKPNESSAGGNDEDEEENVEPDAAAIRARLLKALGSKQREPLASEFVGRRESARDQARTAVAKQGQDWDRLSGYVTQVMANATPEQQTNPKAWFEAWWYVWGLEQRQSATAPEEEEHEEDLEEEEVQDEDVWQSFFEDEEEEKPTREERVVTSPTSPTPNRRTAPRGSRRPKITDATERRTKGHFERLLGRPIPDEEWIALSDDSVSSVDDYNRLQKHVNKKNRR